MYVRMLSYSQKGGRYRDQGKSIQSLTGRGAPIYVCVCVCVYLCVRLGRGKKSPKMAEH
jgi:hypothetical protein